MSMHSKLRDQAASAMALGGRLDDGCVRRISRCLECMGPAPSCVVVIRATLNEPGVRYRSALPVALIFTPRSHQQLDHRFRSSIRCSLKEAHCQKKNTLPGH